MLIFLSTLCLFVKFHHVHKTNDFLSEAMAIDTCLAHCLAQIPVKVLADSFQYSVGLPPILVRLDINYINSNGLVKQNKSLLLSLKTLLNRGCKSGLLMLC